MSERTIELPLTLPKETLDEIKAVAKLAGMSMTSVIKLTIALEVRRWQLIKEAKETK